MAITDPVISNLALQDIKILNDSWLSNTPPEPVQTIVEGSRGKFTVNWKARYCKIHNKCLGDDNWQQKAESEVRKLNKK